MSLTRRAVLSGAAAFALAGNARGLAAAENLDAYTVMWTAARHAAQIRGVGGGPAFQWAAQRHPSLSYVSLMTTGGFESGIWKPAEQGVYYRSGAWAWGQGWWDLVTSVGPVYYIIHVTKALVDDRTLIALPGNPPISYAPAPFAQWIVPAAPYTLDVTGSVWRYDLGERIFDFRHRDLWHPPVVIDNPVWGISKRCIEQEEWWWDNGDGNAGGTGPLVLKLHRSNWIGKGVGIMWRFEDYADVGYIVPGQTQPPPPFTWHMYSAWTW